MKTHKGRFTIEISLLFPILFFLFCFVLKEGIGFYQYSVEREIGIRVSEVNMVSKFYNYQLLGEIGEELLSEEP